MDASTNGHTVDDDRDSDDDVVPAGFRFTFLRALGLLAFLAMALFWIWAFANRDSIAHPDTFDDPVFTQAAESVCSRYQANIAEFPLATAAEGPAERADLIRQGTAELEAMVAELRTLALPTDAKGNAAVPLWLGDWDLYLSDRATYTETLAAGNDDPFLLSLNANGARVTDALGTFAEVNTMASCSPSGDA